MTSENLKAAQMARRLGAWEVVLRLYYQGWFRDQHQPHTGLFEGSTAFDEWRSEHGAVVARIRRTVAAEIEEERRCANGSSG
jgi:hypothetical protein